MSTVPAISHRPTFRFFPRGLSSSFRSSESIHFPAPNSVLVGGFVLRKRASKLLSSPNTMTELIRVPAFGRINGDEGAPALEEEPFVDGASEFRSHIMSAGVESILNRLSKWLVAASFGIIVLCRHDAEALWAAIGSIANSGLSMILKRILNQDRPVSTLRSGPGMPSSHAQSIFFTVVFAIFSMVDWLGLNGVSLIVSGLVLSFGTYLTWLRVSQQLHTVGQVVVGAAVGAIFCVMWFWSWNAVVLEAFVSTLWVRILAVFSAAVFCMGFLLYVIRYWLRDER